MHKKILIDGFYGIRNLGDDYILCSVLQSLAGGGNLKNADIYIVGGGDDYGEIKALFPECRYHILNNNKNNTILQKVVRKVKKYTFRRNADLYIIGGGGLFPSDNEGSFKAVLEKIQLARKLGTKKVIFYGVDICRISSPGSRKAWSEICGAVDYMHFRNKFTYDMLMEICNDEKRKKLHYSTDLTMGYTNSVEADEEKCQELCSRIGIKPGEYIIWALAMPWDDEELKAPDINARYQRLCGQFAEIIDKYGKEGYQNVFLPFYHLNDRKIITSVTGLLNSDYVICEEDALKLEEKRALFVNARACVSMRFHGIMFSLRHGIPVAAVSYAPKATTVMQENGLDEYYTEFGIRKTSCFFKEFDIDQKELERICKLAIEENDRERFEQVSLELQMDVEQCKGEVLQFL